MTIEGKQYVESCVAPADAYDSVCTRADVVGLSKAPVEMKWSEV